MADNLEDRLAMASEGATLTTDAAAALNLAKRREKLNPQAKRVEADPELANEYGLGSEGVRPNWQAEIDRSVQADPLKSTNRLEKMRHELTLLGKQDQASVNAMAVNERRISSAILRNKMISDNKPWFVPTGIWNWLHK